MRGIGLALLFLCLFACQGFSEYQVQQHVQAIKNQDAELLERMHQQRDMQLQTNLAAAKNRSERLLVYRNYNRDSRKIKTAEMAVELRRVKQRTAHVVQASFYGAQAEDTLFARNYANCYQSLKSSAEGFEQLMESCFPGEATNLAKR